MVGRPDASLTLARHLRQEAESRGETVGVYVHHSLSLNGRAPRPLIDPTVDLSRAPRPVWTAAPWIVPFDEDAPFLDELVDGGG